MKKKILIALIIVIFISNSLNSFAQNTWYGTNAMWNMINIGGAGTNNSAFGGSSLYTVLAGSDNTAIGKNSLFSNTDGSRNTAAGRGALTYNTTASDNSAFGYYSSRNNTTGTQNLAIGTYALYTNKTGSYNTAGGYKSLYFNDGAAPQTGSYNTAYGHSSLSNNTTGIINTSIGYKSLQANQTGNYNTACGGNALNANTNGQHNAGYGIYALGQNQTGSYNTATGDYALNNNTTGTYNTALGFGADVAAGYLTNATSVGNGTINQQSNTMKFGNQAVQGWGFGVDVNLGAGHAMDLGVLGAGTHGNGAYCTQGGVWVSTSSKDFKEGFTKQDPQAILKKINELSITKWKYKGLNEYHIGPIAEEFYNAFAVGLDNKSISTVDPSGVALLGIQALSSINNEKDAKIADLQKQNGDLQKRIEKLESYVFATSQSSASSQSVNAVSLSNATLEQNIPNPLSNTTSIRYTIPAACKTAQIIITDVAGKTIKQVTINTKGAGTLNVDASLLSNGAYSYSLIVDGKKIDSRKMIVAK